MIGTDQKLLYHIFTSNQLNGYCETMFAYFGCIDLFGSLLVSMVFELFECIVDKKHFNTLHLLVKKEVTVRLSYI